jgi:para-nitrobenzyl esterase
MSEMWSTFAKTGHPGAKGQPYWPAYTTEKRATMEIDAQSKVVDDPFTLERAMWEVWNREWQGAMLEPCRRFIL